MSHGVSIEAWNGLRVLYEELRQEISPDAREMPEFESNTYVRFAAHDLEIIATGCLKMLRAKWLMERN